MIIRYINVKINLPAGDVQKDNIMNTKKVCQEVKKISFVNGTNDREAYPKFWIAALVQMNCEKKSEEKLNKLGFETYLPIQKEERQWSDRKKFIERVVIPMVIFIRIKPNEDRIIKKYSFIHKLLTIPGAKEISTPIPDAQIEKLRFLLYHAESEVSIVSNLKIGDTVRVVRGSLKGFEGLLSMIEENKPIVAIRIDGLGYACVKIPKSDIKLINNNL